MVGALERVGVEGKSNEGADWGGLDVWAEYDGDSGGEFLHADDF